MNAAPSEPPPIHAPRPAVGSPALFDPRKDTARVLRLVEVEGDAVADLPCMIAPSPADGSTRSKRTLNPFTTTRFSSSLRPEPPAPAGRRSIAGQG
ncbi:hypothetical protein BE20_28095 [Sorangium cellulosum]|uniref:Uncharacterized protein n=1 Tax=Sorangium cellulosum TaxID=56 RepID=A0A150S2Q3_SORCE|nr:hypothetical protein BE20_28095 [Sorangium cellulosum]KYF97609.1 hypothetical protein BE18_46415 [Sorangium cellulosum]